MPCVRWPPSARLMPMMVSPGLSKAEEHGLVGLRAGVGLHVGVLGAEQLLDAVDRELLDDVDVLAAAVVALAGVALGVLVGELRCPAPPSRPARRSFRRRSARCALPGAGSRLDGGPDLGIDVGDGGLCAVEHGAVLREANRRVAKCECRRLAGRAQANGSTDDAATQVPTALPGGGPPRRASQVRSRYRQSRGDSSV